MPLICIVSVRVKDTRSFQVIARRVGILPLVRCALTSSVSRLCRA